MGRQLVFHRISLYGARLDDAGQKMDYLPRQTIEISDAPLLAVLPRPPPRSAVFLAHSEFFLRCDSVASPRMRLWLYTERLGRLAQHGVRNKAEIGLECGDVRRRRRRVGLARRRRRSDHGNFGPMLCRNFVKTSSTFRVNLESATIRQFCHLPRDQQRIQRRWL